MSKYCFVDGVDCEYFGGVNNGRNYIVCHGKIFSQDAFTGWSEGRTYTCPYESNHEKLWNTSWPSRQKPVVDEPLPDMTIDTEFGELTFHCADRNEIKQQPVDECPLCPQHPITELPVATNEISELHKDIAAMANVYRIEGFRKGQEEMRGRCLVAVHSVQQDYPVMECNEDEHCPLCALDKAAAKIESLGVKGE